MQCVLRAGVVSDIILILREQYNDVVERAREEAKEYKEAGTLYGFCLTFSEAVTYVCPYRGQLEHLVFYADIQPTELVKRLPPYPLCPTGCDNCELDNAVYVKGDFCDSLIAVWPAMKRKEKPPKYMRTENNPPDEPFPSQLFDITELLEN